MLTEQQSLGAVVLSKKVHRGTTSRIPRE